MLPARALRAGLGKCITMQVVLCALMSNVVSQSWSACSGRGSVTGSGSLHTHTSVAYCQSPTFSYVWNEDECLTAAQNVGLSFSRLRTSTVSSYPHGCSYDSSDQDLVYNYGGLYNYSSSATIRSICRRADATCNCNSGYGGTECQYNTDYACNSRGSLDNSEAVSFRVDSGPCEVTHNAVSDGPGGFVTQLNCSITVLEDGILSVLEFDTNGYASLFVDGTEYTPESAPEGVGVVAGSIIKWVPWQRSSFHVHRDGFRLGLAHCNCAGAYSGPGCAYEGSQPCSNEGQLTAGVVTSDLVYFTILSRSSSSACQVSDNKCIDSNGGTWNSENCEILVHHTGSLLVPWFETEFDYDVLSINGQAYSGVDPIPNHTTIAANSTITWSSDGGTYSRVGWKLCFTSIAQCSCDTGHAGDYCQYSDSDTCSGSGTTTGYPPYSDPISITTGSDYCWFDENKCLTNIRSGSNYSSSGECRAVILHGGTVTATDFSTEKDYDLLIIDDAEYSGRFSRRPVNVPVQPGTSIHWDVSNSGINDRGFTVCLNDFEPCICDTGYGGNTCQYSNQGTCGGRGVAVEEGEGDLDSSSQTVAFRVINGSEYCHAVDNGRCITDGLGQYGNREQCTIEVLSGGTLTFEEFDTESCCDKLSIQGTEYSGNGIAVNRQEFQLQPGNILTWRSDGSSVREGWRACYATRRSNCICNAGFAGSSCQYSDNETCNDNGQARMDGSCTCNANAAGIRCQFTNAYCGNRGTVTDIGQCICNPPYAGDRCQHSPAETCNNAGNPFDDGSCSCYPTAGGDSCQCGAGEAGNQCQFSRAASCTNGGSPTDSGGCVCDVGYNGLVCAYSDTSTCSGNGAALYNGGCECDSTHSGADCSSLSAGVTAGIVIGGILLFFILLIVAWKCGLRKPFLRIISERERLARKLEEEEMRRREKELQVRLKKQEKMLAKLRSEAEERLETRKKDAIQEANKVVQEDMIIYNTKYSESLSSKKDKLDHVELDEYVDQEMHKVDQSIVPVAGTKLNVISQPDISGIDATTETGRARYAQAIRRMFAKEMPKVDKILHERITKNNNLDGVIVIKGPPKEDERMLNKARLKYSGDLRRITDFERRSIVCRSYRKIRLALTEILQHFEAARFKNRFSRRVKTAVDSAGYRDLQVVVYLPGTSRLLMELQFHIKPLFESKSKIAHEIGTTGQTGHQRYIIYRNLKEHAESMTVDNAEALCLFVDKGRFHRQCRVKTRRGLVYCQWHSCPNCNKSKHHTAMVCPSCNNMNEAEIDVVLFEGGNDLTISSRGNSVSLTNDPYSFGFGFQV